MKLKQREKQCIIIAVWVHRTVSIQNNIRIGSYVSQYFFIQKVLGRY